jgi:hypothetical protein
MERVRHFVELKEWKLEQLLYGGYSQRFVLLDGERRKPMPGLRCDHDASSPASDHVAKLFQHERRAVHIHFENGRDRGLAR